ncbi:MAG: calcium/sodium antiporter [Nanoarchaeota archaeon]
MQQKKLISLFISILIITVLGSIAHFSESLIFFWSVIFIISLYVLIKSADFFTDSAEKLGAVLGIPSFILGVTIVALGTSLPELITSIISVLKGSSEFVAGNVIGSNIANILLIIGIAVLFTKKSLKVEWDLVQIDLPLLMGSAFILLITLYDGKFSFIEAIACLLGYIVYLLYSISMRKGKGDVKKEKFSITIPIILFLSGVGLYYGARYTIDSVIELSTLFNFGDTSIIALSAVALGTSLPELVVSISAARKMNYEMAVGNVLGSNIFNSFVVMGIPGLMGMLTVSQSTLFLGLPMVILSTLIFIISIQDREISKYEGLVFLILYALFIVKLFGLV